MSELNKKWQARFMDMAFMVATWSKDPSTQVGAVIIDGNHIVSMGFNGYPHGVEDRADDREIKYLKTIHAEENAILHANRNINGCSLFATHLPCPNCCAKIIQVGISQVFIPHQTDDYLSRWGDKVKVSMGMFNECGVSVIQMERSSKSNPHPVGASESAYARNK
jgi:dCMP deaminase